MKPPKDVYHTATVEELYGPNNERRPPDWRTTEQVLLEAGFKQFFLYGATNVTRVLAPPAVVEAARHQRGFVDIVKLRGRRFEVRLEPCCQPASRRGRAV
jgi:hypothetical protein